MKSACEFLFCLGCFVIASCFAVAVDDDAADIVVTTAQWDNVVHYHNSIRRLEGASNMNLITWDDVVLKAAAQRLVDSCIDRRDMQEHPYENFAGIFDQLNIFVEDYVPGKFNELDGPKAWYAEKRHIVGDYGCRDCRNCGHYRLMVFSDVTNIGCAVKRCPHVASDAGTNVLNNTVYFACFYSPGAFSVFKPPGNGPKKYFRKGRPCTECPNSPVGSCRDRLCDIHCEEGFEGCSCVDDVCGTIGKPNLGYCSCSCPDPASFTPRCDVPDPHAASVTRRMHTEECPHYNSTESSITEPSADDVIDSSTTSRDSTQSSTTQPASATRTSSTLLFETILVVFVSVLSVI